MITRRTVLQGLLLSGFLICSREAVPQVQLAAIAGLKARDPEVRWASVAELVKLGKIAVPPLRLALKDSDARAYAALTLGKIGPAAKSAVPDLIAAMKDSSDIVRENAAEALGELGDTRAVEALVGGLSDSDPYVNGRSAGALSKLGKPAVPGLMTALGSGNPDTRWSATIALSKMGPIALPAISPLTNALNDPDDNVRWGSAVALGNIGPAARPAVPALIRALSDRDEDVRRGASHALDLVDPSAIAAAADWKGVVATIDTLTPRLMKEEHVPGVAVALISRREIVWTAQFGVANVAHARPVTRETMFEACSMTKPVFAYLVMSLVSSGTIQLDRPLVDYLDPPSLRGQTLRSHITARMVLSHTTGLPNWRKDEEERDGPLPLLFEPGSRFGYSGEGMYYLQRVVEKITGEPLDLLACQTLLKPLGLNHMSLVWTDELDSLISAGHDTGGAFLKKTKYIHPNAAYTLYTSAADYARFLLQLMDNPRPLVAQRFIDTMLTHQVRVDARDPVERPGKARGLATYWGLGWGINSTSLGDIFYHSGANRSGFRCYCQFSPATGSGIVIMTNALGGTELWTRMISRIGNL